MKRFWLWTPFVLFASLFAVFAAGLIHPLDRAVESGMVGRAVPDFKLAPAFAPGEDVETKNFADGKPRLLNVFASWCVPCVAEVPVLVQMKQQGVEKTGIHTQKSGWTRKAARRSPLVQRAFRKPLSSMARA
jgi:cytochrome c biogenesis protein CcmG, thiol:disulfide interchange protein DsbE